jgi:isopenicillin-N epimerase
MKDLFLLDPEITFLNFGSFGACPKPIFETYQQWQIKLEREPIQFIVNKAIKELEHVRTVLGEFVGCDANDLVMVTNPSYAINTIAKSFPLQPGDEILTTNLEYGACDRTWEYYCTQRGAKYIRQEIPLPIQSRAHFMEAFWKGYSKRTKAIFISQITSATGLILPVKEICAEAKKLGLITIVDGAHVPGHIPLNLVELQADIYTGACHKWMMGPKGSSFLYVHKAQQAWVDPLVISWGYRSPTPSESLFIDWHQTSGTRDYAAFLSLPACLQFREAHRWEEVALNCKALVRRYAPQFCALMETEALTPISEEWLGQMFSIPINTNDPLELKRLLYEVYHIEIPVTEQKERYFLRYSIQGFNTEQDLDNLYQAMRTLKNQGTIY